MEFKKMTDEDIIEYCRNNNIQYLNKNKKAYTKKTLIKYIMNSKEDNEPNKVEVSSIEPKYINKVVWTLEQTQDPNENYKKIKDDLNKVIKKCHDLLYSSNAIVGIKAQNDIMKILTVIILKPQFMDETSELMKKCNKLIENGKINIKKEKYSDYLLYCKDIKELANTDNPFNEWKMFVNKFLSKILPFIYTEDDTKFNFDTNEEKLFRDIIVELSKINIDDEFIDAFSTSYGDIHEAFRVYNGGKGSKELGQFFTPRHMIHAIFNGCGFNEIIKSYDNPTIYDPCMGTGGLLTRAYSNGNILPNNIYGCETEKDTIKFAGCGVLLTTKQFNSNLERCDSICNNPYIFEKKFDIIFTNPPFGTNMKYKDLKIKFNAFKEKKYNNSDINFEDIYTCDTNNGACLFIQLCIHLLSENGTCAIILPDGELMTSNRYNKFRKMMCEKVNILKIINVEGGAFEHTGIKTNVLIFNKKGKTNKIEFMQINKECNEVILKGILPINNKYEFTFTEKKEIKVYDMKVEIKKLDDIFIIEKGILQSSKNIDGEYTFITASDNYKTHINYNKDCECLLFVGGAEGSLAKVHYYKGKFIASDLLFILTFKENIYNYKYFYYIFNHNRNIYINDKTIACGTPKKSISIDRLKNIEIPIPSLEIQEIIVNKLDKINNNIETIKKRINQLKDEGNLFMETYNINTEIKKLGEVCIVKQGIYITKDMKIEGPYPVYGGGNVNFYINKFNREDAIIIAKDGVSENCIRYEKNKFFLNHHAWTLNFNKDIIINKFLYYYLLFIEKKIFNIAKGTAQLGINQEDFYNLEIHIPSIEVQNKLVSILDNIYNKIDEENKHIELLKQLSKDIITVN